MLFGYFPWLTCGLSVADSGHYCQYDKCLTALSSKVSSGLCACEQVTPAAENLMGDSFQPLGVVVWVYRSIQLADIAGVRVLCAPVGNHLRGYFQMKL